MMLVASIVFLTALASAICVIGFTLQSAIPRINSVIVDELSPAARVERRVTYGAVKQRAGRIPAEVVFLRPVLMDQEFKLAA